MEYDLAVAWEWPLDNAFVERLLAHAAGLGLTAMAITRSNLASVLRDLGDGRLRLRWLLDRAADEGPDFAPLGLLAEQHGTRLINHAQHQDRACDKARNHILCAARGVPVPLTIIVPPFIDDPNPPLLPAALVTAVATFLILGLERYGFRPFEAVITVLVGVIALAYVVELVLSRPSPAAIASPRFSASGTNSVTR